METNLYVFVYFEYTRKKFYKQYQNQESLFKFHSVLFEF